MSEEETRAYMQQLRSAPVSTVVTEVLSMLLQAAQVKVGRKDARLLIDLAGVTIDHARPNLPGELTAEVDRVLGQLRLSQVEAETASGGRTEENDLATAPAPPSGQQLPAAQPAAGQGATAPGGAASKLWIPGR